MAYDGLCSFEFGVATELFGLARPELDIDWYEFEVVSIDEGPLRATGGVSLTAPTDLSRIETADLVVLPGWRDPSELPPEALVSAIQTAHGSGARIMSICSGVFVLAATGLLDGQRATTHWRYTAQLQDMYPSIDVEPDVLYVDNGTTLTSAGSAAGIDLGLHIIRGDFGAYVANQVARRFVVAPHRAGGQAQFITATVSDTGSGSLAPTVEWAMQNLSQPLSVAKLARHAHMTPRTFARRFRNEIGSPPYSWLVHQRVALAQRLLETGHAPIDEVAQQSGFGTAMTLRHHFGRITTTTPTRYRTQFHQK